MTVVQRSPNIGLTLRMQRKPVPAPATTNASGDAGPNVFLLPDVVPVATEYYYDPETGAPLQASAGTGSQLFYRPVFDGWRLLGAYLHILNPFADRGGVHTLRAIALGVGTGSVTWSWTLDAGDMPHGSYSSWWDGVELEEQDGTLRIRVLPGEMDYTAGTWWATLTCTASVDGAEIGRIVLRPGFNFDDVGSLPVPE